jgi:flagellar capping protein FliD
MAQYQITVDSQLLQQLFLGNSKDSGVAKLLESVLNQVLQAQLRNNCLRNRTNVQMNAKVIGTVHIPIN